MRKVMTSLRRKLTPAGPTAARATTAPAPGAGPEAQAPAVRRADDSRRRRHALERELIVRAGVSIVMLVFNDLFTVVPATQSVIRVVALFGLLVNGLYYLAARGGRHGRLQAYVRMSLDVGFITAALFAAGGLAAAPYLGAYAIVSVYTGIVFSSRACRVITLLATLAFLTLAGLQAFGVLPRTRPAQPDAWGIAVFNLLVLNIVGWLAAALADAYRRSRRRLAATYSELERAHEESLRVHAQIQRAGRLFAVSEVVAGVTHEMRNVLQGVFGHLWLVRRKLANAPPDVDEHLARVEESCEHVMRIIRTTLDMAQQPGDAPAPVALDEVVARATELKAYDLRRDGIALTVDVPGGLPRVRASAFQLQQVLLNLITNAQDELRDRDGRREIVVAAAPDPTGCVLEVRDTGPGIPRAILPRVFEPFFTTKETGAGLGLAISAGIVERVGGRLTAANRRDGGAVFRLTLPAA
jgi:signal transduction histidine kinase